MDPQGLEYLFDTEVYDGNANWKLCCPFHGEVTPSFMIHKDTGQAYCWGCGWAGSVVYAIQVYCGAEREKANRIAADKLGFRLVEGILKRREMAREGDLVRVCSEAWLEAWPKKIHKSILERGLSVDILRKSGTRYDPKNGGRQVFPHRDKRGALVGAAGRSLANQDPKWYFYWGYSKGRSLYYGAVEPRYIQDSSEVFVTEGVFDTLWLQQHGITNTVGILGSKPSKYQIAELAQYKTVVLALDNDVAGCAGTLKLYKALKHNCRVKFIQWPGNDPMDTKGNELCNVPMMNHYQWRRDSRTKSLISEIESRQKLLNSPTSSSRKTRVTVMQP